MLVRIGRNTKPEVFNFLQLYTPKPVTIPPAIAIGTASIVMPAFTYGLTLKTSSMPTIAKKIPVAIKVNPKAARP